MGRLTAHFDYCSMFSCKAFDENLAKENKCRLFDLSRDRCHEKAVYEKLRDYEDAEENGLLLRLPCELGQKVYVLAECGEFEPILDGTLYGNGGGFGTATGYYCPYELYDNCPHTCYECDEAADKTAVFEDTVTAICYDEMGLTIYTEYTVSGHIGEYIFLTREEAEKALAERSGE